MTGRMAKAFGVVDGPISASMWSSWISFLTFCTARVVSPPSSSEMYSTPTPPIVRGRMSPVLRCGMPIADVGPVADTIKPILICANAVDTDSVAARASASILVTMRCSTTYVVRRNTS